MWENGVGELMMQQANLIKMFWKYTSGYSHKKWGHTPSAVGGIIANAMIIIQIKCHIYNNDY